MCGGGGGCHIQFSYPAAYARMRGVRVRKARPLLASVTDSLPKVLALLRQPAGSLLPVSHHPH